MLGENPRRSPLARFTRLAPALVAVTAARAGLRLLPLPRLARALGVELGTARGAAPSAAAWADLAPDVAEKVASVDAWLRRWPSRSRCLVRALGAGWLLRDRGPVLRIGVAAAPLDASWAAHAWLELDGAILPDPPHAAVPFEALRALGRV